jgi:hypothetical protein
MRFSKFFVAAVMAMGVLLGHESAHAQATVNISIWTSSEYPDLITEVEILGPGGGIFTFADPYTAPDISDPDIALVEALANLGLAPDTPLGNLTTLLIGTDMKTKRTVISPYNPIDNPDKVLGDPDDPLTWINIGSETFLVEIYYVFAYYDFFRLTATIREQTAQVPLPASGALLFGALMGLGAVRARRRTA